MMSIIGATNTKIVPCSVESQQLREIQCDIIINNYNVVGDETHYASSPSFPSTP